VFKYQKRIAAIITVVVFLLMGSSCGFAGDKTFKGRVTDADTKEPIEGAVVVAHWKEARGGLAGQDTRLKEVKETLTDKNGEWSIIGPEGRFPSPSNDWLAILTLITGFYYTRPPEFTIFKPGYCPWPDGFVIEKCKKNMKPEGNDEIAEGKEASLPELENKADRLRAMRIGPFYEYSKKEKEKYISFLKSQKNFIKYLNQEKRFLGLQEYKYDFLED
jgi:hypothetical protein